MKLQPLNMSMERPDVLDSKHRYGFWYGLFLGLGFAFFTWGFDAFMLNTHRGLHPWLKFLIGAVICMMVGAVIGWLSAKANKSIYSVLLWLAAGLVFAWLTVNLPLVILPKVLTSLDPHLGSFLNYTYFDDFGRRILVAYIWVGIFITIAGLLQIPLSDSAVFSTSIFGKLGPLVVTTVLMAIAGTIVDNGLINQSLRDSVISIDNSIQFVVNNRGKEVDPGEARRMHTGALRAINDSVTDDYRLVVSGYDGLLEEINILVKFEMDWVECKVIYNQLISCKELEVSQ